MPIHQTDELLLHYQHLIPESASTDCPILLLAGMASDSASWQPVVMSLQSHYELILPDNRCTGQTQPNPIETTRELMIDDVLTLLDAMKIDKVNIIGHSMGGMLAWTIASKQPDRVKNLIVASALPYVTPARIALFSSLSTLRSESNEAEWFKLLYQFLFVADLFNDENRVNTMVAASSQYEFKQNAESYAQQVKGLSSFLPDMIQQFKAENDWINMHIIENAAHALHWEQSEQFIACVLTALQGG